MAYVYPGYHDVQNEGFTLMQKIFSNQMPTNDELVGVIDRIEKFVNRPLKERQTGQFELRQQQMTHEFGATQPSQQQGMQQAEKALQDLKQLLQLLKRFLETKNADDALQRAFRELQTAAQSTSAQMQGVGAGVPSTSERLREDAEHLRFFFRHIVSSPRFRSLLVEFLVWMKHAYNYYSVQVAHTRSTISEHPVGSTMQAAGQKLSEMGQRVSNVEQGRTQAQPSLRPGAGAGPSLQERMHKEQEHDVHIPEKQELQNRLQALLWKLSSNEEDKHAMQDLLWLLQRRVQQARIVTSQAQSMSRPTAVSTSHQFSATKEVLENIAGGYKLDELLNHADRSFEFVRNDTELSHFWRSFHDLLQQALSNRQSLKSRRMKEQCEDVLDTLEDIVRKYKDNPHLKGLYNESDRYMNAVRDDHVNREIERASRQLSWDLRAAPERAGSPMEEYNPSEELSEADEKALMEGMQQFGVYDLEEPGLQNMMINPDTLNGLRLLLGPYIVESLRSIDLPPVEGHDLENTYWFRFENIRLMTRDLIPDKFYFQAFTDNKFKLLDKANEKHHDELFFAIKDVHFRIENMRFMFDKKTFPSMKETNGICDVYTKYSGVNISVHIVREAKIRHRFAEGAVSAHEARHGDMPPSTTTSQHVDDRFIDQDIWIRSVRCKIDKLNIDVKQGDHKWMENFMLFFMERSIRHRIENEVEERIKNAISPMLSQLDESLRKLYESSTSQAVSSMASAITK